MDSGLGIGIFGKWRFAQAFDVDARSVCRVCCSRWDPCLFGHARASSPGYLCGLGARAVRGIGKRVWYGVWSC